MKLTTSFAPIRTQRRRVVMPPARPKSTGSWQYQGAKSEWVTTPLPAIADAAGLTITMRPWDAVQLIGYRGEVITDVGVANRTLDITINGAGGTNYAVESTIVQVASTQFVYCFGIDNQEEARGNVIQRVPFWTPVIIGPTALNVVLVNFQPADGVVNQFLWFRAWRQTGEQTLGQERDYRGELDDLPPPRPFDPHEGRTDIPPFVPWTQQRTGILSPPGTAVGDDVRNLAAPVVKWPTFGFNTDNPSPLRSAPDTDRWFYDRGMEGTHPDFDFGNPRHGEQA